MGNASLHVAENAPKFPIRCCLSSMHGCASTFPQKGGFHAFAYTGFWGVLTPTHGAV